jgi:hypothetical protein
VIVSSRVSSQLSNPMLIEFGDVTVFRVAAAVVERSYRTLLDKHKVRTCGRLRKLLTVGL